MIGMTAEVINFRPRRLRCDEAEKIVQELAERSENVILTDHAKERMGERDILVRDMHRILKTGYVTEDPEQKETGEWTCKITKQLRGNREAGVVTLIQSRGKLLVLTVEWEDL